MTAEPRPSLLRGAGALAATDPRATRSRFPWSVVTAWAARDWPDPSWPMADPASWRAAVEEGFSLDFGHDDLLAGRAAPAEVFPRIADWPATRSRP